MTLQKVIDEILKSSPIPLDQYQPNYAQSILRCLKTNMDHLIFKKDRDKVFSSESSY